MDFIWAAAEIFSWKGFSREVLILERILAALEIYRRPDVAPPIQKTLRDRLANVALFAGGFGEDMEALQAKLLTPTSSQVCVQAS